MRQQDEEMGQQRRKAVFIVGSRGIPAAYGGFETFAEELVRFGSNGTVAYHVACRALPSGQEAAESGAAGAGNGYVHYEYLGADCFTVPLPKHIGSAAAIFYDLRALKYAARLAEKNGYEAPVFLVLGNTAGGFLGRAAARIKKLGGRLLVNPDGLEWKRDKWPGPVKKYLKYAEGRMVRRAHVLVCDNAGIEKYIQNTYGAQRPVTCCLTYGTDLTPSGLTAEDASVRAFFARCGAAEGGYVLTVGRLVPENNYEAVLRGFLDAGTDKKLLVISETTDSPYYRRLLQIPGAADESRVCFAGGVYDRPLLKYIRENAFAYVHGHTVGGTNPSLLESLAAGSVTLAADVSFNRETAADAALYWRADGGGGGGAAQAPGLADALRELVAMGAEARAALGERARELARTRYDWAKIIPQYEELFLSEGGR
ncbi:MAG: DUF1972 domain-containing protein [Clostridiales Family XIII bacterium]|jgi:rhamnosyltransferase|nr:DUF1972 domain-containing protein [Clostridiales Family XIII bacterium]